MGCPKKLPHLDIYQFDLGYQGISRVPKVRRGLVNRNGIRMR
jgi:hypothetical protein